MKNQNQTRRDTFKMWQMAKAIVCLFLFFGLSCALQAANVTTAVQQAAGNSWNNVPSIWSDGNVPTAGNTYEVIAGGGPSRVRNPVLPSGQITTFAGDSLTIDAGQEIRFKGPGAPGTIINFPSVGGNPGLICAGCLLNVGDDMQATIQGKVLFTGNSTLDDTAGSPLRAFRFQAPISGAANATITIINGGTANANDFQSPSNTYNGTWTVNSGYLLGSGSNSLGSNSITMASGTILEVNYNLKCYGTISLAGTAQLKLHSFIQVAAASVAGNVIPNGTYTWGQMNAAFPANFPSPGSGSVRVGPPIEGIFQDASTDYIAWEAENLVTIVNAGTASWATVADAAASNGGALQEQGASDTANAAATAQWTLVFKTAGTYHMFIKYVLNPCCGANSYKFPNAFGTFGPNDAAWQVSGANENTTGPTTYTVIHEHLQNTVIFATFTVAAGDLGNPLILQIGNREAPGLTIDRIVLSQNANLAAAGNGAFDSLANSSGAAIPPFIFITQPVDSGAAVGGSATFTAATSAGTAPITYLWYTNGVADPSATTTTYSRTAINANENGRTFKLKATDSSSPSISITSSVATLTVLDGTGKISVSFLGRGDCADSAPSCTILNSSTVAGLIPQLNWNNVNNHDNFGGATGFLTDGNGGSTVVTLTYDANDAWYNDVGGVPPTGNSIMMKGISKANGANRANTYTFNGLASGLYDVYVYINVNGDGRIGDMYCNGVTNYFTSKHRWTDNPSPNAFLQTLNTDPAGVRDTGNYVKFTSVPVTSAGSIPIGFVNRGDPDGVGIAGFQVVASSAPVLVNADSRLNPNGIRVVFGTAMGADALNPAHYSVDNGVTVSGAAYGNAAHTFIQLTTSALTLNTLYTVTVSGVHSSTGQALAPDPSSKSFTHGAGLNQPSGLTLNRYDNAAGINIGGVRSAINNCTTPNFNDPNVATMEYNPNLDNYGTWIYGIFAPPTTGNYQFALSSDDNSQLWLSTDSSPANKVLLTSQGAWNGFRGYISGSGNPPPPLPLPVSLVAGRSYYFEVLHQEGGGGDHVSVAVQKPGDPAITDGQLPIPRSLFASRYSIGCPPSAFFNTLGPIAITEQPSDIVAPELYPVTFFVGIDGTPMPGNPSYAIQWYSNGVAIAGATKSSYTRAPLRFEDGDQYYVTVSNDFSGAISSVATLFVDVDSTAPTLVRATSAAYRTNASAVFSEPLTLTTATNYQRNYKITNAAGVSLAISGAELSPDGKVVTLTTAPQVAGAQYFLVASNVQDRAGVPNTLAPNPSVASFLGYSLDTAPGLILFRAYNAGGGNNVSDLTGYFGFPGSPDFTTNISGMNSRLAFDPAHPTYYNTDAREAYGASLVGHFIPPTSGNWIMYIANDDGGRLSMNTNGPESSGASVVADSPACCRALSATFSSPINLIKGQAYYIEALYKEGTGGDFCQVAARLASDTTSTLVPLAAANLGLSSKLQFTLQPVPTETVTDTHLATFSSLATLTGAGEGSQLYQWQVSTDNGTTFTDIPGATSANYSFIAYLADNQHQFRVKVSSLLSTIFSTATVLTVVADGAGPVLLSVRTDPTFATVTLTWDEIVDPVGAGISSGNYYFYASADPGTQIFFDSATHTTNSLAQSVIVLHVDPLNPAPNGLLLTNAQYVLEVDGQHDLTGNHTVAVGSPIIDPNGIVTTFRTLAIIAGVVNFEAYTNLNNIGIPGGYTLNNFIADSALYPGHPSFSFQTNVVNWPQSFGAAPGYENYVMRFFGLFYAQETGLYRFNPAHDDDMRLSISSDATAANKGAHVLTAGCCTDLVSGPTLNVQMVAGNLYYFELLVAEFGGGDYAGVAVTTPSGIVSAPIDSTYIAVDLPNLGGTLTISTSGGVTTLSWVGPGSLYVADFVEGPYTLSGNQANPQTVDTSVANSKKFYQLR